MTEDGTKDDYGSIFSSILDERERFVLISLYAKGNTLSETAKMIGRTVNRVRCIRDHALGKIGRELLLQNED